MAIKSKKKNKKEETAEKSEKTGKAERMTFKQGVALVKDFFTDNSVKYVIGIIIAVFAVFLCSSFVSFLTSGGEDQTVLEAMSAGVSDAEDVAVNTSGKSGAILANYFINECFGWAAFMVFPLLVLCSLKLMYLRNLNMKRWVVLLVSAMLWASILFSFVIGEGSDANFVSPGGKHGNHLTFVINDYVGPVGVILLLALGLLFIMIYLTRETIPWLQKVFSFNDDADAETDGFEAEDEAETEKVLPVKGNDTEIVAGDEETVDDVPITGADSMTDEEIAAKLDELNRKNEAEMGGGVIIDIAEPLFV